MYKLIPFLCLIIFYCLSCQNSPAVEDKHSQAEQDNLEAIDDSLALVAAYDAQSKILLSLSPSQETNNIKAAAGEDAADDPAIWIHPTDRSKSLVYGSNKQGGLAVYNLKGEEVAYYPLGKVNNVDILYNFPLGDSTVTLLGCSNRTHQSIDIFSVDPNTGKLNDITNGNTLAVDTTRIDDIYGFCFAQDDHASTYYAIINGKNGLMQQFEIVPSTTGVEIKLSREVQFDSQTEGMVADNELGYLYVGEENKGVWKLSITPNDTPRKHLLTDSNASNPKIVYDIEGLTLYKTTDTTGYLIASSQGNFSYAVFERTGNNPYINSFKILNSETIDGVEETDGLDAISDSLSPAFPKGLLVFQDGFNYEGDSLRAQNFKYVSGKLFLEVFYSGK